MMNHFLMIGLIGFAAILACNLIGQFALGQTHAQFFSEAWWSNWFANYTVWITFAIIGLGYQLFGKNNKTVNK